VILKNAESKYFDIGQENIQLFHNLGYGTLITPPTTITSIPQWFNPWINIQQDNTRFGRVGEEIVPRGMSIKLYLANKTDRPNTMVRVIVAILPKVYNGSVTSFVFDPLQISNLYAMGNNLLKPADTDKGVKFLYDRIHRFSTAPAWGSGIGVGAGTREITKVVRLWIKPASNRKIKWDTQNNTIVNRPLAIYCIPYEQYSTLTTDNITSMAGYMRLHYKDP